MSMEKTKDAARGRWRGIITTLGIDPTFLDGKHHKCPFCGGKDRFRFDDKDGSGSYFCSGCKPGLGMDLVMNARGWDFARAAKEVDELVGTVKVDEIKAERSEADKVASFMSVLKSSKPVTPDTATWKYLERRCGDPTGIWNLRHHPALRGEPSDRTTYPAMVATMRYANGERASVHRTFLTLEGLKANLKEPRKIMPGLPLEGSSVQLAAAQECLGVAEGIETSLCASLLFGLPVWAAISANGILSWVPPEGTKSIVIFGDNDAHKFYEGQKAAYAKAQDLRRKGFDVEVCIPAVNGKDWADVWAETNLEGVA
jgi:putative DNA primase/helicase